MTSTTGTTQHPDVAEISDLTEGNLPQNRMEDVRRHIDECALCADVRASLEEIRSTLGTLPGPPRMPSDVAGRIDAALAAEALLNSSAPDAAAPVAVSRETPAAPNPPASVPPRVERPAGQARAATGPGRRTSRTPRRRALWGAVLGTATVGLGVLLVQSLSTPASETGAKDSASSATLSQQFSGEPLKEHVDTLLASAPEPENPLSKDKNAPSIDIQENPNSPKAMLGVPSCIQKGTGRTETPLGFESGSYEGKPAYLLVLPHASKPTLVHAYVVDASCIDAEPTGKGNLLLTDTYPRR
ncbi:hypothetical protein ACQPZG_17500 [Streptomyces sp. CA-294286]|uniref:hypothetical protein n=1 Tax=Streptomyces sp. CA-294286 TaxID=3240070 RepID=UPI003D8D9513